MSQEFGFRFRRPTPVVFATLVVLVALFVVFALAVRFAKPDGPDAYVALSLQPALVLHGQHLWSLLTYALLHSLDDTDHLVFNGLIFYFFAPDLEDLWGRGRFVLFMMLAALGGAAFVVGASALHISDTEMVVGFSGVVMAVTTAWGLTFPDREMFLLFFRMRGLHLVYITVALQVLTALSFSRVSAAAHFGGMAVGAAYALSRTGPLRRMWLERRLGRLEAQSAALRGERPRRGGAHGLRVIQGGAADPPKDKRYLN
jgi:membrane associated rhomboid family serine protease